MLSPEHLELFQTMGMSDSEDKITLHLGCQDHPTICQSLTVDLSKHEITFMVIQKRVTVSSITLSFNQMHEATKFIMTAIKGSNRIQKAS